MIWSIFSSAKDFPQVKIQEEDGFIDLSFHISKIVKSNESLDIEVKGKLKSRNVGFNIKLLPNWNPQPIEGMEGSFYWGEAYFKSNGSITTAFIEELASLYGAQISNLVVPDTVYAQVVGLACNPENIENEPCKMKFFFNSEGDESVYSEIFINIDLQNRVLEFNEKDMEYRAPLLRSLIE